MTHKYNDHSTAGHYIQTGHPWHVPIGGGFNATEKDWPAMGSIVEYVDQHDPRVSQRDIPSYVYLPNRLGHMETYSTLLDRPGQYAGWLGRGYDAAGHRHPQARRQGQSLLPRLHRRGARLPHQGSGQRRRADARAPARAAVVAGAVRRCAPAAGARPRASRRTIVSKSGPSRWSPPRTTRKALDIRQEPAKLRDQYGRHLFGQSTLLARRLVEAGARFVTVGWDAVDGYSWDSHLHSDDVRKHLLPGFDQALSSLVTDLDERGLLDETLVVCLGEMGRTPQANPTWGRGHWSTLFPAVLAGGGIRGGMVYGRSDKDAALPVEHPTSPEDLAATIFHALGIDPELRIPDAQGRPVPLVDGGRAITELFG